MTVWSEQRCLDFIVSAYWITLLVMAVQASKMGKRVWKFGVRENDFGHAQQSPSPTSEAAAVQSKQLYLTEKQSIDGVVPVYTMAYNAPQTQPQGIPSGSPPLLV